MNLREVDFEGMEIRRYLIETRMVRRQLYLIDVSLASTLGVGMALCGDLQRGLKQ